MLPARWNLRNFTFSSKRRRLAPASPSRLRLRRLSSRRSGDRLRSHSPIMRLAASPVVEFLLRRPSGPGETLVTVRAPGPAAAPPCLSCSKCSCRSPSVEKSTRRLFGLETGHLTPCRATRVSTACSSVSCLFLRLELRRTRRKIRKKSRSQWTRKFWSQSLNWRTFLLTHKKNK